MFRFDLTNWKPRHCNQTTFIGSKIAIVMLLLWMKYWGTNSDKIWPNILFIFAPSIKIVWLQCWYRSVCGEHRQTEKHWSNRVLLYEISVALLNYRTRIPIILQRHSYLQPPLHQYIKLKGNIVLQSFTLIFFSHTHSIYPL